MNYKKLLNRKDPLDRKILVLAERGELKINTTKLKGMIEK